MFNTSRTLPKKCKYNLYRQNHLELLAKPKDSNTPENGATNWADVPIFPTNYTEWQKIYGNHFPLNSGSINCLKPLELEVQCSSSPNPDSIYEQVQRPGAGQL